MIGGMERDQQSVNAGGGGAAGRARPCWRPAGIVPTLPNVGLAKTVGRLVGLNPAQGFNGSNNSELWRIDWIMVPEPFKSSFLSHNQRSKWHDQLLTCFAFVINLVAPGFVCTFTKQAIFDQCDLGSLPHLLPCGLDRADLSVC